MTQSGAPRESTVDPLASLRARFRARAAADLAWLQSTGGEPADELMARAHKLAGSGGTFGYPEISRAAAALEDDLRDGLAADLAPLIAALEAAA